MDCLRRLNGLGLNCWREFLWRSILIDLGIYLEFGSLKACMWNLNVMLDANIFKGLKSVYIMEVRNIHSK